MARGERKREPPLQLLGKCHLKKKKKKKLSRTQRSLKERNKASLGILVWARFPRDCELRTVGSIVWVCCCFKSAYRKKTAKSR